MARGRWRHTANLMAMLANVNRDPKKGRAFGETDFNPYAKRPAASESRAASGDHIMAMAAGLGAKFEILDLSHMRADKPVIVERKGVEDGGQ